MRHVLAPVRRTLLAAMLAVTPAAPMLLGVTTVGCGDLKEAFELSKDIKSETGIDTNVAINVSDGRTKVTITLGKKPDDPAATEAKIREMVKKRFPKADEVEIVQ